MWLLLLRLSELGWYRTAESNAVPPHVENVGKKDGVALIKGYPETKLPKN